MRNLASSIVLVLSLLCVSCDKQDTKKTDETDNILNYLNAQKIIVATAVSARSNINIDLLKENLNLEDVTHELLNNNLALTIVPLKTAFIEKNHLNQNSTLTLVLVTDGRGTIKSGTVVYFLPRDDRKRMSLPQNTFSHLLSGQAVEVDGTYNMVMMTGRLLSQFQVKDHKLFGLGTIQPKNIQTGSGTNGTRAANGCMEWYMVMTYYYTDGRLGRDELYLGTRCPGDGCDQNFSSICDTGIGPVSSPNEETLTKEDVSEIRDYETPPSSK